MSEYAINSKFKQISRKLRTNMTDCEQQLWCKLNKNQLGVKFRRQYAIENKYIVDFICLPLKLVIELDGGQHNDNAQDKARDEYLQNSGFDVLRFWNTDIISNLDGCLEVILEHIQKLSNK